MVRPFVCTTLLCLAAACSRPAGDRPAAVPATHADGTPAAVLTIAYADPRSRRTVERGIDVIVGLLSDERLVGLSKDGRPQPRLAERWEVSPDGLTWRFVLRRGLIFHNGEPITSAAVKAAIVPPDPAPSESETLPGLRDVLAVETPTPLEVVVRLKRPNAFLLESLNLSPVTGSKGAASGPFRLDARTPGKAVLGQFKGYYRGRSSLETIAIAEYPSQREAWSAMLRGDVDVLYDVAPEAFEFVKESPNTHVASFLRPYVTALTFNVKHPVLGRRDVRRALNLAIDRQRVIDAAAGGRGIPATDHIWPNHWARDASAPVFDFDLPAARAGLEAAGLRARTGRPARRITFTCLVQADPRFERLALLMQRQLLSVDVDMRLEALALPEFQERVTAGRFDAFLSELIAGHGLGFTYMLWHANPPGPFFRTGYAGANEVLDQVRDARTDDDVRTAVHALQRTMHADPPAVFLYWGQASRAVRRRFILPGGEDQDILRSVDRWQLADGDTGRSSSGARSPGAMPP